MPRGSAHNARGHDAGRPHHSRPFASRPFFRKNGYRQVRSPSRTAAKLGRTRPELPTGRPTKFGSRRSEGPHPSRRLGTSDHVILLWPGHRLPFINMNGREWPRGCSVATYAADERCDGCAGGAAASCWCAGWCCRSARVWDGETWSPPTTTRGRGAARALAPCSAPAAAAVVLGGDLGCCCGERGSAGRQGERRRCPAQRLERRQTASVCPAPQPAKRVSPFLSVRPQSALCGAALPSRR